MEKWSKINKREFNQGKSKELWLRKKKVKDSHQMRNICQCSCTVKNLLRVGVEYKLDPFWECIAKSVMCIAHGNKCVSLHCAGETSVGALILICKVEWECIGNTENSSENAKNFGLYKRTLNKLIFPEKKVRSRNCNLFQHLNWWIQHRVGSLFSVTGL